MTINCNNCVHPNCNGLTMNFNKAIKCPSYIKPQPFKVPLLLHLLTKQPKETTDLLVRLKLLFKKSPQYPYFNLIPEN